MNLGWMTRVQSVILIFWPVQQWIHAACSSDDECGYHDLNAEPASQSLYPEAENLADSYDVFT